MVRYFLTDLRGNPIYSFAQRLRRNNNNNNQQQQQQLLLRNSRLFSHPSVHHPDHPHQLDDTVMITADDDRIDTGMMNGSSKERKPPPQHQLYHVKNFSSMTLVCYVRNQQWEDVMKRISQAPYHHEVYMVDSTTGNTILHTVCRYNPPSYIVQALCNPSTVRAANYDGTTPLHIAASHRCSKDALQTLFDCCRLYYNHVVDEDGVEDDDEDEEEDDGHLQRQPAQHTSPTADLSRIGRAPIHYACMSFRGLDIAAFKLLLNETLQYGNIWVYENTNTMSHSSSGVLRDHDILDDMDDLDLEFNDGSIGGGKKGMMEVVNENEVYGEYEECRDDHHHILYEFENETDQSLYQLYGVASETTGWKSSSSSVENDALTWENNNPTHNNDTLHSNVNPTSPYNDTKILVNVMGMKDATGQTPIGLLFRRYRERVRCVINTVDKIRSTSTSSENSNSTRNNNNNKAALVAAIQVHADLGELWERARWIISRLTEERLLREQHEKSSTTNANSNNVEDPTTLYQYHQDGVVYPNIQQLDATSRRTTYYGGSSKVVVPPYSATSFLSKSGRRVLKNGCCYNGDCDDIDANNHHYCNDSEPPSPIAQEAASWACELHPPNRSFTNDPMMMLLPFAPDISTSTSATASVAASKLVMTSQNNVHAVHVSTNSNNFRIVHASVGLTGYGCPPELIRLAISIHPNQVMEMDTDGNLPIHIAVTAASYLAYTNPIDTNNANNASTTAAAVSYMTNHFNNGNSYSSYNSVGGDDHSSVMSDAALSFFSTATVSQTTNPFDQVIKILLQQYPDSARVPQGKSGRLPLVLAIEESKIGRRRTWNDGIRTLLHAYPPALHNKKIIEPILYPHVLSLVANNGTTQQQQQQQQSSHSHPDGSSSFAFDFSGYVDVVPNSRHPAVKKRQQQKESKKKSQRTIRQELCCRTTLYELLRSKPDWLTLGISSAN